MGKKKKPAKKPTKLVWRKKDQSTASSSAAPPPPPPWVELPRDLTANILERLGPVEILESVQKVCTTWRSVCKEPSIWRKIKICSCGDDFDPEIMCRHAVDRSEGQLLDITIHGFGSDMLLEHIANRSSQLRGLTLAYCEEMTGEGIVEAIKRFPLMEELHLSYISVAGEFIEQLGHSCPSLKSFSVNKPRARFELWDEEVYVDDGEALAIAKSLPQLCHLSLIGNQMSNKGLMAILDGCTHLESLDLRLCLGVDLKGDLGKRCSIQLKLLKQPNELAVEYDIEYAGEYDNDDDEEVDNDSYDGFPDWLGYDSQMSDYDVSEFGYGELCWDGDQDYNHFINIFSDLYDPDLLLDE